MRNKTILCVIDSLGSGGAQRQLVNLAVGFKEQGHEVSFLVYHKSDFFLEDLLKANIEVDQILETNFLKRILKIRKYIRTKNCEVVLSFLEPPNFICELAAFPSKKWKLIVGERSADPKILTSVKRKIFRWFHLLADHVVANSNANMVMVKKIVPILPERKCHVIYNYVDEDKWSTNHYFDRDGAKLKIIVAASHQYLKNAKGLIEAVNLLSDEEKAKLIINWYGDESPDNSFNDVKILVKKYHLNTIIKFHPATNDIHLKVNESDVVGLFSLYEGLPNIVCEAMILGKTIIASNVSDIKHFINKDFVFNPNYPLHIKEKLIHLMSLTSKDLEMIGDLNREKAIKLFNKEKIIQQYLQLMK